MTSIRTLHVIPSLADAHGGPSRAMRLIERALRSAGVQSETATTDDDGNRGRIEGERVAVLFEDGATRRYFRKTTEAYKVSLPLANWLFRHACDYNLVHIHALFSFSSTAAAWAARRAGVPYVVRPLGTLGIYGMTHRRPRLKRLSLAMVEGSILRHAAAVHFTSQMECQEALSLSIPMRSAIVPLAIEAVPVGDAGLLSARYPALRGNRWVLFLSRLDPKKNIECLLHAIALLREDLPETRWLLAGDGDAAYVERLHALAAQLGVGDRLIWAGHLEGAEKAAAFTHSELFVLPSFSENFGIAAAEALQAGLPVVLGKGVALSAQVEASGAGRAVEPEAHAIAAAMREYLQNPVLRSLAAANARAFAAATFSMEVMGNRLSRLYEDILTAPDRKWSGGTGNE